MTMIIDESVFHMNNGTRVIWKIKYAGKSDFFNKRNEVNFSLIPLNDLGIDRDLRELSVLVPKLVDMGLSLKSTVSLVNRFEPRGLDRREHELEKGIGTYFMNRVYEASARMGSEAVVLECTNLGASHFYDRMKFGSIGYRPRYKLVRPNPL